jgi:hypothetical protein
MSVYEMDLFASGKAGVMGGYGHCDQLLGPIKCKECVD